MVTADILYALGLGAVWTVAFESPMITIEKILFFGGEVAQNNCQILIQIELNFKYQTLFFPCLNRLQKLYYNTRFISVITIWTSNVDFGYIFSTTSTQEPLIWSSNFLTLSCNLTRRNIIIHYFEFCVTRFISFYGTHSLN